MCIIRIYITVFVAINLMVLCTVYAYTYVRNTLDILHLLLLLLFVLFYILCMLSHYILFFLLISGSNGAYIGNNSYSVLYGSTDAS